jgi:hypothetical protein
MPTVNFSSPFWQATFTNGTEFCGDATGVGEAVDPDTGTIIQMLTGVMKMANVNNELVLGVSALTCNSFNPGVIPTVECRVLLPRAFVFTQFRFDLDFPGTVRAFYYSSADRSALLSRQDHTYTQNGEAQTLTFSNLCDPIRLVVIEFDNTATTFPAAQRGSMHNIEFEDGVLFGGRLFFVSKLYCLIKRLGISVLHLLRLR